MRTAGPEIDDQPAVTMLKRKDLLGIADLTSDEITLVLDTTVAMKVFV